MKVLVVDDRVENRYLLEILLTASNFKVISAENGLEAIDRLKTEIVDLIISDILLPKMDGFQLCRLVKEDPLLWKIPFIFYTAAYTEESDRIFALSLGADRYVIKPTEIDDFMNIIQDLIDEYSEGNDYHIRKGALTTDLYLSEHNQRLIGQLEKQVSQLEDAYAHIRESEEKYRKLFNSAQDVILLQEISRDGELIRIIEVNETACRLLEYAYEDLLGMSPALISVLHIIPTRITMILGESRSETIRFESMLVSRSNVKIPVEVSAHRFMLKGKHVALSICRDISERKRNESEIARALEQITHNMEQFSILNDKIRNPLTLIDVLTEDHWSSRDEIKLAIDAIDDIITELDKRWLESEKVRNFLLKHYNQSTSQV